MITFSSFRIPPFDRSVELGRPLDFGEKFAEHAAAAGLRDSEPYTKERATFRNRILYAADDGLPEIHVPIETGLALYRLNTFLIPKAFILLDVYKVR